MKINLNVFRGLLRASSSGSTLLIVALAVALGIGNTDFAEPFDRLLATPLGGLSVLGWVNDALMSVFFLLVGLEIKRELVEGELADLRHASLPVIAAIGGALVPALIYFALNRGTAAAPGWGIPMATDIAFALAALSILGRKVPASLKVFLSAMAIVDDLIAILVIAIFYSAQLQFVYLLYAAGVYIVLLLLNRFGAKSLWLYLIPGVALWYFVHHSGIHATIAGVLLGFTLPTNEGAEESPLEKLESMLTRPVNLVILPLFALANTAIHFKASMPAALGGSLSVGIIAGLLIGKPAGILLASRLAFGSGIAALPRQARWSQLLGVGVLGGIGFTMSTFIAVLSFKDPALQQTAKFAVLIASAIAATAGVLLLRKAGSGRAYYR
jgi:NhaA family Na+:H+ antiporter